MQEIKDPNDDQNKKTLETELCTPQNVEINGLIVCTPENIQMFIDILPIYRSIQTSAYFCIR